MLTTSIFLAPSTQAITALAVALLLAVIAGQYVLFAHPEGLFQLTGLQSSSDAGTVLLNISSTGMLVETGSKLEPGSVTKLHLCGPDTHLVVPARFVRSEVAAVNREGVKYHAAAMFQKPLDLSREGLDLQAAPYEMRRLG